MDHLSPRRCQLLRSSKHGLKVFCPYHAPNVPSPNNTWEVVLKIIDDFLVSVMLNHLTCPFVFQPQQNLNPPRMWPFAAKAAHVQDPSFPGCAASLALQDFVDPSESLRQPFLPWTKPSRLFFHPLLPHGNAHMDYKGFQHRPPTIVLTILRDSMCTGFER